MVCSRDAAPRGGPGEGGARNNYEDVTTMMIPGFLIEALCEPHSSLLLFLKKLHEKKTRTESNATCQKRMNETSACCKNSL